MNLLIKMKNVSFLKDLYLENFVKVSYRKDNLWVHLRWWDPSDLYISYAKEILWQEL